MIRTGGIQLMRKTGADQSIADGNTLISGLALSDGAFFCNFNATLMMDCQFEVL